jgi:outer membrane protein assembly factor BamB
MKRVTLAACGLVFGSLIAITTVHAENWPQWRGAQLDGISHEKNLPTKWSKTEGILWRLPMPGPAGATPAVWDDRIFVTSVDKTSGDLLLLCIGTDGKEQWRQAITSGNRDVRGDEGNSASPSPSTDGEHVWAFMANGELACYTVSGKKVWQLNVQDRYGKLSIQFGMTSTPVLDGDKLYLQLIHGEGNATTREAKVVALEKLTGKQVWAVDRPSDATDENEHSYASPIIYRDKQREYLLTHGADYIIAHSLKDGSELWRCGNLNPRGNYERTLRFVASPVAVPGLIIAPSAKNYPVLALKPDGQGDLTEKESALAWKLDSGTPDVPSPLVVGDYVYLCRENGNLVCLDRKTGEKKYEKATTRDRHRASPVYADGNIYTSARNGIISVIKVGPEFELVSQNNMEESISSSPAISNGRIYVRTFDALYAIGPK